MAQVWLNALLKLQEVDLRKRDLETRLSLLPKEMNNLISRRDALRAETAAAAEALRKAEATIAGHEAAIAACEEENRKLQQQTALVKKNNEYQAMLASIENNRKHVGECEEKIIALLDETEKLRAAARRVKAENDAAIRGLKSEFDELYAFSGEVKKEIALLEEKRAACMRGVDADVLRQYNRLLGGRGGGAPVARLDSGESCSNCHLKVIPQSVNLLRKGEVIFCDNCQHFLYDPEAVRREND